MAVRRLHPDQPSSFSFTPENIAWAQATIKKYPPGKEASAVIPVLWRAQEQIGGWVTEPSLRVVADLLGMAYIRVYEVATFYTMFQLAPIGRKGHIQVCGTTPCMLRGAPELVEICRRRIHDAPHHVSNDGAFSWEEVECLGSCANAPMVQIASDTYEDLNPDSFEKLLAGFAVGKPPQPGSQTGRRASSPKGGLTSLKDAALFDGSTIGSWKKHFPELATADAGPAAAQPAKPVLHPAVAVALANAGLVPELNERGGGKALSTDELERLKTSSATLPVKPKLMVGPRGGKGDDLKLIWGVGPKLEDVLNRIGVYHFDQIASWSDAEIAWVDSQMEDFRGRAHRDKWIEQAKKLATGWRPESAAGDKSKDAG